MTTQLSQLHAEVQKINSKLTAIDFLNYMRYRWLEKNLDEGTRRKIERLDIQMPSIDYLSEKDQQGFDGLLRKKQAENPEFDWGNYNFHYSCRISELEELEAMVPEAASLAGELRDAKVHRRYLLSILPLDIAMYKDHGNDLSKIYKYLPTPEWGIPSPIHRKDPYDIWNPKWAIARNVEDKVQYLATFRFRSPEGTNGTALFNWTYLCHHGCAGCYKGHYTREMARARGELFELTDENGVEHLLKINRMKDDEGNTVEILEPTSLEPGITPVFQTKQLVRALNGELTEKELVPYKGVDEDFSVIDDVIISGGEPLLVDDETLEKCLAEFENAKNLKILRICTGVVFQGNPFRITDKLLDMLEEFQDKTGIDVKFHLHLSYDSQFTPEAAIAIRKIKSRGFEMNSQVPIQNGVNFWTDDIERTIQQFDSLGRLQASLGVKPYKYIVDMHPETARFMVPIETLLELWSRWYGSHARSDLYKPETLSGLTEAGNLVLGADTLLASHKEVDPLDSIKGVKGVVTYYLPGIVIDKKVVDGKIVWYEKRDCFKMQEPLIVGINDDPESLDRLREKALLNIGGLKRGIGHGPEILIDEIRRLEGRVRSLEKAPTPGQTPLPLMFRDTNAV